jgi:hypothetical protein
MADIFTRHALKASTNIGTTLLIKCDRERGENEKKKLGNYWNNKPSSVTNLIE